jgi:excinuclease ABC subunit C
VIHKGELLSSILESYYQNKNLNLPEIIVVPEKYEGIELLEEILGEEKDDIHLRPPLESQEEGLLRIAHKNAKVMVKQEIQMREIKKKQEEQREKVLKEAQKILDLPSFPRIIEGFDISNIGGKDATGSMVYFQEGKPLHKNYRHYNIRSKSTPDDVGMMKEVIYRRYSNLIKYDSNFPDLILVDGGRGQLNGALEVLDELGLEIPAIGLAKRFEEIYVPEAKDPINLPDDSSILQLFQQIRDEAHRFAVRLHKKQRKKRIKSKLDSIKGVGPVTRKKLLSHFGSVKNIKKASREELEEVVNQKLAKTIIDSLNEE